MSALYLIAIMLGLSIFWLTHIIVILFLIGVSPINGIPTNWEDYWYSIFGTFSGAGLALFIQGWLDGRKKEKARKEIVSVIQRNLGLLGQIVLGFSRWTPNFPLDTSSFNVWVAEAGSHFTIDEKREINNYRYQLEHINTKLGVYYAKMSSSSTNNRELRRSLTLIYHCGLAIRWGQKLLKTLARE